MPLQFIPSFKKGSDQNKQESRRTWILWLFKGMDENKGVIYQFWKLDNHPEICNQVPFIWQKLSYIHNNPVHAGILYKVEE